MKKLLLFISILLVSLASFGQRYTIEVSQTSGFFQVNGVDYPQGHFGVRYDGEIDVDTARVFSLYNIHDSVELISSRYFDEVAGVSSWDSLSILLIDVGALSTVSGSSLDVNIQDQTTPLIIAKFSKEEVSTTLFSDAVINLNQIAVVDPTGFVVGKYLSIFSVPDNRFYLAYITAVAGATITLDSPLDFSFPAGSFVTVGESNMNVNGSGTPVIFGVRNTDEQIGSAFDITRIIIHCETSSSIDLSKFGDIAGGLANGIVLRKVDGIQRNVFNAKTNGELKSLMYDFDIQLASGNQQDGFTGRMTFGGQSKMGVVIRLDAGEDLQFIIQDDLTGLELLEVICEGHTVEAY